MFTVDGTKVYFEYDSMSATEIEECGINLPERYADYQKELRVTWCMFEKGERKYYAGLAVCSPSDIFEKARGRKESLTRALKRWRYDKKSRTIFWKAYHSAQRTARQLSFADWFRK